MLLRGQREMKRRRLERGWSQTTLAEEIGVRTATICEWENDAGRRPRSWEHVQRVHEVLGIAPELWLPEQPAAGPAP